MLEKFQMSAGLPEDDKLPVVHLIDDDKDIRSYIRVLLESVNISVEDYVSVEKFVENIDRLKEGCILSDIVMPDVDGFALLDILNKHSVRLPIVFMSAYGDIETARSAFKGGAVDFIQKPISATNLIDSIKDVLKQKKHDTNLNDSVIDPFQIEHLTKREKSVFELLMEGYNNKEIAKELEIGIRTVETHRHNILKKLNVTSLQKLITSIKFTL